MDVHSISTKCTRTEFVGTAVLDTIGLVISGVDDTLLKEMNIGTRYHTLGLFSSRTGAAGQITAVDDAVKATGTEVLSIDHSGRGPWTLGRAHAGRLPSNPRTCRF